MPGGGALTPVRKRAGQRRHTVTLSSSETTTDDLLSQLPGEYEDFGRDQVAIEEIPFIVDGSEHGMLYNITLKWRADIVSEFLTLKKRVRITKDSDSFAFDLLEIENPEQRNIELVLHCAQANLSS